MDSDSIARSQIEALRARVEELERQLEYVFNHLGLEAPDFTATAQDDMVREILSLVRGGKEIDAIKLYRVRTGSDLGSAKEAVDRMKAEQGLA